MKKRIGIIGGGNMGSAIISSLVEQYSVCVCEKDARRAKNLKRKFRIFIFDISEILELCDVIILAVKPQNMDDVLEELACGISNKHLLISIAAGIKISYFEKIMGRKQRVIRAMPNMPAQIGAGITAISKGCFATSKDLQIAKAIFSKIGQVVVVEEKHMDAVTAVSGSGPAYVFFFIECLFNAAKSLGLNTQMSQQLVLSTLKGSIDLLAAAKERPEDLRSKVTSKGGTTQAAISIFEKKKMQKIFKEALKAAAKRSKQLSRG